MSKTEHELSSDGDVGALDEMFAGNLFDAPFGGSSNPAEPESESESADLEHRSPDESGAFANPNYTDIMHAGPALDEPTKAEPVAVEPYVVGEVGFDLPRSNRLVAEEPLADEPLADVAPVAAAPIADEPVVAEELIVEESAADALAFDELAFDELVGVRELESDGIDAPDIDATDERAMFPSPAIGESDVDVEVEGASADILEELRRADIDGPLVAYAPQDDTTAAVRRPRRTADYDPAPVPIPSKVPRVLGRKPRVRKVTRVVRHVDPWSVFKIAAIAHLVLYVIVLTASVLLWNVANSTGTVDNVERFFESFGWDSFEFDGGQLYHSGWIAGLFVVIGFTGLAVLAATLFNLITDLVGGVRFTVLEEEVLESSASPLRRFVVRRPEPEVPALLQDASGPMYREAVVDDTGANQRPTR